MSNAAVRVEDAHGLPPTIPFWLGEAPGRSDELSLSVSRLRRRLAAHLTTDPAGGTALRWLIEAVGLDEPAAAQLVDYAAAAHAALGCLPTQDTIVLERFFDAVGGMQLVIHSPYGSRISRAWGLALRKRFCRKFNFELGRGDRGHDRALADHGAQQARRGRPLPQFGHRPAGPDPGAARCAHVHRAGAGSAAWRSRCHAFAAARWRRSSRAWRPRILIAAVFPDQLACAENLVGEREIPDHPLVGQTIADCLRDAMDIEGLERLLAGSSPARSAWSRAI